MHKTSRETACELYTKEYFLSQNCDGYEDFIKDKGLSYIKRKQVSMLEVKPGNIVLDVGCGRGELLYNCLSKGAVAIGIDYSSSSVEISQETLKGEGRSIVLRASADSLPFAGNSIDRIIMGDVLEHISPEEARRFISETSRVLKEGGIVLIHTSPNIYFMKFAFPLIKFFFRVTGKTEMIKSFLKHVTKDNYIYHMKEYNLFSLKKLVAGSTLNFKVWLDRDLMRGGESRFTSNLADSKFFRFIEKILSMYPFVLFFSNDLWAKGIKRS